MPLKLKKNLFCGLSKERDFTDWLREVDINSYNELMASRSNFSCKENTTVMMALYQKLYTKGKGKLLEGFLQRRYPMIIDTSDEKPTEYQEFQSKVKNNLQLGRSKKAYLQSGGDLNKHGVFKHYNPKILSFPQKKILKNNDPAKLMDAVKHFISGKLGVDYIIVEDRAYIEYFEQQYASAVDKLKPEKREIFKYRKKMESES